MEHCVRKQCFMFYHFLTQFHVPRIKLRLIIGTPFCHGTTMFYVLCFTIYLTWYSMPIGHGYAIFDWTFCHETMFYVLPFTWPDSLYFLTFTFEGRLYLDLCFMYYHLPFEKVNSSCHKPEVRVGFWYNILSWNNVVCFTIYLTYASTPFNLLMKHSGMKQCFMFYHLLEPICYCL